MRLDVTVHDIEPKFDLLNKGDYRFELSNSADFESALDLFLSDYPFFDGRFFQQRIYYMPDGFWHIQWRPLDGSSSGEWLELGLISIVAPTS